MGNFDLESEMRVCQFVDWQPHHFCFFDGFSRLVAETPLSVSNEYVFVAEPFSNLLNRSAICVPQRIA